MVDRFIQACSSGAGTDSDEVIRSLARRFAYVSVAVLMMFLVWMYAATFMSMIRIWSRSDTFSHGFAVFPISGYLIWKASGNWLNQPVRPSLVGFVALVLLVLAWLISSLTNIQAGQHLAVTGMLGAVVWTILGTKVAREICFPLLFANFAAPFGNFLIPPLMEWTAGFTVWAVNFTGIPVFREGMNFALPSGSFGVVEACSGARYLLVTVFMGALYSYIIYKDWRRRALFMVAAVVLPIIANGIRAYSIVLIAHYSDFRFGAGSEHFIVGWIIFAVLILMLFVVGLKFSDNKSFDPTAQRAARSVPGNLPDSKISFMLLTSGAVLLLLTIAPYFVERIQIAEQQIELSPNLPVGGGDWSGPAVGRIGAYDPINKGTSVTLAAVYDGILGQVGLYELIYQNERQGGELVNWHNQLYDSDRWVMRDEFRTPVSLSGSADIEVESVLISDRQSGETLLVWTWYDLNGLRTSNKYEVKFQQAWQLATFRNNISVQIVLVTQVNADKIIAAQALLGAFVREFAARLSSCALAEESGDAECVEPPQTMYSE